ncbi:MAG: alpha/beta fold hydrolase [Candidatus Omnitrophica bacterium]|nr:alpha/beta fold hydrolase [Candidatus Omnitrophota bacterium]
MAKDAYINSSGLKIHLLILEDQKDSPVIIFVHASGFYAQHYIELLTLLNQRGFNVIGVDLEGHGKSEGKRGDFTFKEVVGNIYDTTTYAIENYNGRIGIIGTSQGGMASFYALSADKRLKSGCCHCAAILSERQSDCILPIRGRILKPFVKLFGKLHFLKLNLWTYIDRYTFYLKPERLRALKKDPYFVRSYTMRSLHSLATAGPPKKIEAIKTPIMFIHPDNDGIFPMEYMRSLFDKLTCYKRFEVIPGMKHMFLEEHPEAAIDTIDKWFKETLK